MWMWLALRYSKPRRNHTPSSVYDTKLIILMGIFFHVMGADLGLLRGNQKRGCFVL